MYETTVDGWDQWKTTHTSDVYNNCWWTREMNESIRDDVHNNCWWVIQMNESIPDELQTNCSWTRQRRESILDDVRNNCWWTRLMKDYQYQTVYKITVCGWVRWGNLYPRWCAKQLLTDKTNEGLPIPDDVQNNCWWMRQMKKSIPDDVQSNCWWMRQMKKSIPDDVQNNCWWMRPIKDYPHQMRYKTTVDGSDRWRNPYQMVYETTVDG